MAKTNETIKQIADALVLIGALVWGLDALDYNIVNLWLGSIAKIIYGLVGLSGLYLIYLKYIAK